VPASSPDSPSTFHLDLEDYLQGLLQLASELARYAINSVVAGDNDCPFRIAAFLGDLDAKFRLLNLKNDALRKRFDALKYDVQKVGHSLLAGRVAR
jgi:predicted translin family RNA/ssDNA-binding protein